MNAAAAGFMVSCRGHPCVSWAGWWAVPALLRKTKLAVHGGREPFLLYFVRHLGGGVTDRKLLRFQNVVYITGGYTCHNVA